MSRRKLWQNPLPFSLDYTFSKAAEHLEKAAIGENLVLFVVGRRISFTKIKKDTIQSTSELFSTIGKRITYENNIRIFETEFMSKVAEPIEKHLHVYERSLTRNKRKEAQRYRCVDPDCKHYIEVQYIIGKRIGCFRCHKPCLADRMQCVRNNKILTCIECSNKKQAAVIGNARNVVEMVLENVNFDEVVTATSVEEKNLDLFPKPETLSFIERAEKELEEKSKKPENFLP